ncbi:hypothetical protein ERX46_03660 [Brumimicrobium glaciale]|uniref:Alanine dehydrogenase/pyridine nucleotide transhydrogenase N-terminal domain-containing protein n=1 Tax=Brumimicrobium glaciale TaxID=200475 RepID=A0A4Q4KRZ8_9FLAO|nr:hypothetical protein [Brumimicrobium glaciale]RYM36103.1 hypothetical protein ERX46_03660 [Brumimicrobium glaciale]
MNNIGIVKGDVCSTVAMPSPEDIRAISKFVDVFIQSNAGTECGYSDNEYALEGCFIRDNSDDVIQSSDLILFQNPISAPLHPMGSKVIIANIDFVNDREQLKFFMHKNIDLYSFEAINDSENTGVFKDKFVNFVRFHLGDPVQSEFISLFSRSKILTKGEIVHKDLL